MKSHLMLEKYISHFNLVFNISGWILDFFSRTYSVCSYGSVVEYCISSVKECGFNSQGTHILIKNV